MQLFFVNFSLKKNLINNHLKLLVTIVTNLESNLQNKKFIVY